MLPVSLSKEQVSDSLNEFDPVLPIKFSCSLGFKPWGRLGRCGIGMDRVFRGLMRHSAEGITKLLHESEEEESLESDSGGSEGAIPELDHSWKQLVRRRRRGGGGGRAEQSTEKAWAPTCQPRSCSPKKRFAAWEDCQGAVPTWNGSGIHREADAVGTNSIKLQGTKEQTDSSERLCWERAWRGPPHAESPRWTSCTCSALFWGCQESFADCFQKCPASCGARCSVQAVQLVLEACPSGRRLSPLPSLLLWPLQCWSRSAATGLWRRMGRCGSSRPPG